MGLILWITREAFLLRGKEKGLTMVIIYGSKLCPDCVACLSDMEAQGVEYEYRDFSDSLLFLKEFLAIRESNLIFAGVKASGKIGIPCLVYPDGTVSLKWK